MIGVDAYNVFMRADLTEYIGEWIAIANNEIVAHGKDIKAIYNQAKARYPNLKVTITKIPEKQNCIF